MALTRFLQTLDEDTIASILQEKLGKNLVPAKEAQKHLKTNLVDGINPTAIELALPSSAISQGLATKVSVNGIYQIGDGEVRSIIAKGISFRSSDHSIATASNNGKITAHNEGMVEISTKYGRFVTRYALKVTHTTLTKIEIAKPTLAQLTRLAHGDGI